MFPRGAGKRKKRLVLQIIKMPFSCKPLTLLSSDGKDMDNQISMYNNKIKKIKGIEIFWKVLFHIFIYILNIKTIDRKLFFLSRTFKWQTYSLF